MVHVLIVTEHRLVGEALAYGLQATNPAITTTLLESLAGLDEFCRTQRPAPQVALVDYRLGDGQGIDATAILAANDSASQVVMMSEDTSAGQIGAALAAGCAGFIDKTDDLRSLHRVLRAAVNGEQAFGAPPTATEEPDEPQVVLTPRQGQVLQLLAAGTTTEGIASTLGLSIATVRNHIRFLTARLGAHSRIEAVSTAFRIGLMAIPEDP